MRLSTADEAALRENARDGFALLARLHHAELDKQALDELRGADFASFFALLPEDEAARQACDVINRGWKVMDEGDEARLLDELAADYAATYLTYQNRVSPTESVWLDDDNLERQEPMMKVREWYERFGAAAPDWRKTPDDHIALQLAFLAHIMTLRGQEDADAGGDAAEGAIWAASLEDAARFLDEHLMLWLDDFAAAAASQCATPFYAGLAMFTRSWVKAFRDGLTRVTGLEPPLPAEKPKTTPAPDTAEGPYVPGTGPAV